jgi:hypothetical protein
VKSSELHLRGNPIPVVSAWFVGNSETDPLREACCSVTPSTSFTSSTFCIRAYNRFIMDNKQIARILRETAQLLEI